MATRAGCDNALAIFAMVLSFTENSADFVAPMSVNYIAILRLGLELTNFSNLLQI